MHVSIISQLCLNGSVPFPGLVSDANKQLNLLFFMQTTLQILQVIVGDCRDTVGVLDHVDGDNFIALHCIALHCIALHCIALPIALHC